MYPIAIEKQLETNRWPFCTLQFLLAISEVNANLMRHNYFVFKLEEQIKFRYFLDKEIIDNPYLSVDNISLVQHDHQMMLKNRTWNGTELIKTKISYSQQQCKLCKIKCKSYCTWCLGRFMCEGCYTDHVLEF